MAQTRGRPLVLLLTLGCLAGLAHAAPPAETANDAAPPVQDGDAPRKVPAPAKTGSEPSVAAPEASRPNVDFKPSEEISEDFSVAFPTDI